MELLTSVMDILVNPNNQIDQDSLKQHSVPQDTIDQILKLQQIVATQTLMEAEQSSMVNESGKDTFQLINKLKKSLEDSLVESEKVQNIIKVMFSLTFLLGFILIGIAIFFGWKGETFLATAFGGFGMLSIVTLLLKDPPIKMQDSRSNYAQLTVGILAWLNDLIDKGAMSQQNQLMSLQILQSEDTDVDNKLKAHRECIENYLSISNTQIMNTVKLLNLIDQVAEPSKKQEFSLKDILEAERSTSNSKES